MSQEESKSPTAADETFDIDGLNVIPFDKRTTSPMNFSMIYWSSYIAIQILTVGLYLMVPIGKLNFVQVMICGFISIVIAGGMQALLSDAGARYGIPFVVQIRSAFGMKGAKIIGIFRSIPAIIWNGICTWFGADALALVCQMLFGFGNPFVFFIILMAIQVYLCIRGFQSIQWFDSVMSIAIFAILIYFFYVIFSQGSIDFGAVLKVEGSWGAPFFVGMFAGVAHLAACLLNGSDLVRHMKVNSEQDAGRKNWIYTMIGVIPPWMFMFLAGTSISMATGSTNPVAGLAAMAPNTFFAVLLLLFLVLAQVTSNLSLNLLCAGMVFQDVFHWNWKFSIVVAGIASMVICPWILQGSDYFLTVQNLYSMFLAPACGILVCDYYFVRRKKLRIKDLYSGEKYDYTKGFSIPAMLSLAIGWIAAIVYLDNAWIVGFVVSLVVYTVLKLVMKVEKRYEEMQGVGQDA